MCVRQQFGGVNSGQYMGPVGWTQRLDKQFEGDDGLKALTCQKKKKTGRADMCDFYSRMCLSSRRGKKGKQGWARAAVRTKEMRWTWLWSLIHNWPLSSRGSIDQVSRKKYRKTGRTSLRCPPSPESAVSILLDDDDDDDDDDNDHLEEGSMRSMMITGGGRRWSSGWMDASLAWVALTNPNSRVRFDKVAEDEELIKISQTNSIADQEQVKSSDIRWMEKTVW